MVAGPTWLRHGPGLTLHGGAGRRREANTGHVGSLDLELVEGSFIQTVHLQPQRQSVGVGVILCVWMHVCFV